MYTFVIIMLCGAIIGYLRRDRKYTKNIGPVIHISICAMLFMLGMSIGSNKMIIENFGNFCGQAIFISAMSIIGSLLASWAVMNVVFKKKGEKK